MELLKNPLIIGALIPMLGFGLFNVFWAKISSQFTLPELILGVATAGIIGSLLLVFFGGHSVSALGSVSWWKIVFISFLWVISVSGMTLGFMYGGTASTIVPIVNANTLISVAFAFLFLGEVFSWNIAIGSLMIVIGASLVVLK